MNRVQLETAGPLGILTLANPPRRHSFRAKTCAQESLPWWNTGHATFATRLSFTVASVTRVQRKGVNSSGSEVNSDHLQRATRCPKE